jgi:dTDP-4-amino-4,6-dideoxygalactose transaminase
MKEIPLVDLKAGFAPIREEVLNAIERVLADMSLYIGPNCTALEKEFASYCGSKYAVGVGSGTEALQFALLAHGVKAGDEVITSPHTFFATVEAIACLGAKPVFVDIDPLTFNIDPAAIENKITKKTKAIIAVHMYGQTADMDPIIAVAEKHCIPVVEDACQSHGATYKEKKTGAIGDTGCFSFYFTKNLGAYGEGGMITTSNEETVELIRLYRNHGHTSKYEHAVIGYNGRLDEMQAAVLRIKLKHLDEYNRLRREKAVIYQQLFKDIPIIIPIETSDNMHVFHLYVVRTPRRDELQSYLAAKGVATGIHYKNPIHLQEALKGFGYGKGDFPVVEKICSEILSLPIYPELQLDDQLYIADQIKIFFEGSHR